MKLSRRASGSDDAVDLTKDAAAPDDDAGSTTTRPGSAASTGSAAKGRPTPKRRVAEGRRGPVTAPKTRKEAYARQKQLDREKRVAAQATVKPRSVAEQRAALKRGDPSALPRRDQGPTRKLARDYVDAKRMFSNYLLWLFVLFVATSFVPVLHWASPAVLIIFVIMIVEWYYVGRKLRAMAIERFGSAEGTAMSIGFYMGSRAYLPRKWRLPGPQVQRGDDF